MYNKFIYLLFLLVLISILVAGCGFTNIFKTASEEEWEQIIKESREERKQYELQQKKEKTEAEKANQEVRH